MCLDLDGGTFGGRAGRDLSGRPNKAHLQKGEKVSFEFGAAPPVPLGEEVGIRIK
jgi:hypothetical protein